VAKVLYVTHDGITDHIGQAQIAPYCVGLARKGHQIHIVSAEKRGREALRSRFESLFDEVGIRWTTVPYSKRPPLISTFFLMMRLFWKAKRVSFEERPDIVHCRSYLPLEVGLRIKKHFNMRYLVDFRDFWADVGIETKRFKFVYRYFLRREPRLLSDADHVVTLTQRAASLLLKRYPQVGQGRPDNFTVIPCCADFELFDLSIVPNVLVQERRTELGIPEGVPVLLYIGSLGSDYLVPEMMALFQELRSLRPDAIFLILGNDGQERVEAEAMSCGVPRASVRFTSVPREAMPTYLALATLSVVFIRATESKSGCSPTKLAELLAANVPVIANTGVGDLDDILSYDRNSSVVVPDFEPATLQSALVQILRLPEAKRLQTREASRQYSLEEGIRKYDKIYRELMRSPQRSRLPHESACSAGDAAHALR